MSSASLASHHARFPSQTLHPDRVRIAALSVAIAVNLAVLLGALRPLAPGVLSALPTPTSTAIRFIDPPAQAPPPPLLDVKPLPLTQPLVVHSRATPIAITTPTVMPTDEGNTVAPVAIQPTIAPTASLPVAVAPVEATLAYRAAPLTFPPQAARQHMQGEVVLRVLVDEQGVPYKC
jgi:protein TonB